MTIEDFILKAKEFDVHEAINNSVRNNEQQLLSMNRDEQLFERGIDSNNRELPQYRPATIVAKMAKNQRFDHTTLKDTGEFHSNFKIITRPTEIEFTANSTPRDGRDLTIHLQARYGVDIFGLTEENKDKLRNIVRKEIIEELRKWV